MEKIIDFFKFFASGPWWVKVLVFLGASAGILFASQWFTSCASTHSVSQSFIQRGDTMTMIRYEQVGSVRK